jgi:hypothetical protein
MFSAAASAADESSRVLQASWKDASMSAEDKAAVEAAALAVPVGLVRLCHEQVRLLKPTANTRSTSLTD